MAALETVKTSPAAEEGGGRAAEPAPGSLSSEAEARALAVVAAMNQEFRLKTDSLLSVPLALLVEQRDRAIVALEETKGAMQQELSKLMAEQDSFIAFLTEDQQKQLATLEQQLSQAKVALERQAVLTPIIHAPLATGGESELRSALDQAEAHIATLREQLENAYREVDESRADGWRLQEERDEAIRATDDLRIELMTQLDAARDEIARIQLVLDSVQRELADVRDEAREQASRLIEDQESLKIELDERRAEVTRLRERLESTSDLRPSQPPPPAAGDELERARAEAKVMRKQLIDSKRELSRITRELELARAQRGPLYRPTPSGGLRPSTRTGTTQPGVHDAKG
ncbi:MAG TPA: hypothetical protein VGP93_09145, partial [Polyangiaceae bacterium]|nr:hypothetical protein [Polyangiaceae bacterium]